jgi:hypothetical protein
MHSRRKYNDSDVWGFYNQFDISWAKTCYPQLHLMAFDRRLGSFSSGRWVWSVEAYMTATAQQLGTIDAIVLWVSYPTLGIDARSQFDVATSLPGGPDALPKLVNSLANFAPVLLGYLVSHCSNRGILNLTLFPHYIQPWDTGTTPPSSNLPLMNYTTTFLRNNSFAGIYAADATSLPPQLYTWNSSDDLRAGVVFALQTGGEGMDTGDGTSKPPLEYIALSRSYSAAVPVTGLGPAAPPQTYTPTLRWLEPRHTVVVGSDWARAGGRTAGIHAAFVAGTGSAVTDNAWAFSNPVSPLGAQLLRRAAIILHFVGPLLHPSPSSFVPRPDFSSVNHAVQPVGRLTQQWPDDIVVEPWMPVFPSNSTAVASAFFSSACPGDLDLDLPATKTARLSIVPKRLAAPMGANCSVFLFANLGDNNETVAINITAACSGFNSTLAPAGLQWYDLYAGTQYNVSTAPLCNNTATAALLRVSLEPRGLGAVLATPDGSNSEALALFLTAMRNNVTSTPLSQYNDTWAALQQVMAPITPGPGVSSTPPGTTLVPGTALYQFTVNASLPEPFGRPPAAGVMAGSAPGVDVQVRCMWSVRRARVIVRWCAVSVGNGAVSVSQSDLRRSAIFYFHAPRHKRGIRSLFDQ